jgi:putative ABC transport system permease protein
MSRRHNLLGLLWRQFGSERGASVAIAGVVLVVSFGSAAVPRALEVVTGQEIAGEVSAIPSTTRDLSGTQLSAPALGPSSSGTVYSEPAIDDQWGAVHDALVAVRDDVPTPARDLIGDPEFLVATNALAVTATDLPADAPLGLIRVQADPVIRDRVELTAGEWPATAGPDAAIPDFFSGEEARAGTIEIMLSTETAERMAWAVGESRSLGFSWGSRDFLLSGTFDALDASEDYWSHIPTTLVADYFDNGNRRPTATGGAFVAADGYQTVVDVLSSNPAVIVQTRMWFPTTGDGITGATADTVLSQLRQATSKAVPLGAIVEGQQQSRVKFSTGVVDALDTIVARSSATTSVLLLATAGPLGVAIAVIALAGRLVAERRRPTLSLIAARGGSNAQLRSVLALEGLVLGLPAAVLGIVAAVVLIPAEAAPASYLLPALVGLAPAGILALAAAPGSLRQVRSDLGAPATGRRRVIVELVAIVLAVASVTLLLVRGADSTVVGVDPLLIATPLLLSLAACVVVLRVFPLPLAAIERMLHPRKGVVGFVGAARALRDPVAGLAPVLAMIVAVSVAVFSGAMFATLNGGVDDAAQSATGSDLRARGPVFTAELLQSVLDTPGVTSAVPLDDAGGSSLTVDRRSEPITVFLADTAALAALQHGLADAVPDIDVLREKTSVGIPIIASSQLELDGELSVNGAPVDVVATQARIAGTGVPRDWILADAAFAGEITIGTFSPRILLVNVDGDAPATGEALEKLAPMSTTTQESVAERIRSSAFVSSLQLALALLIGLVGILCAVAIVLVSTINNRARSRLLAVLRTLGFDRGQSTALIAWELAPVAITALVTGTLLGIGLPLLVLAGIDLTPFTGGAAQPALALDPWLTAAVLGGFVLVVAAASSIAALGARRTNLASALREGEE